MMFLYRLVIRRNDVQLRCFIAAYSFELFRCYWFYCGQYGDDTHGSSLFIRRYFYAVVYFIAALYFKQDEGLLFTGRQR